MVLAFYRSFSIVKPSNGCLFGYGYNPKGCRDFRGYSSLDRFAEFLQQESTADGGTFALEKSKLSTGKSFYLT